MPTPEEQLQKMIANLEASSGKPLEWWLDLVTRSGLAKHGERVAWLKTEHGLGHGYANTIAQLAARGGEEPPSSEALVEAQYRGKEHLRPIYEEILAVVRDFGPDITVAPKKASVSLRRGKQFALITPATKTRVDLGINLPDHEATTRLVETPGAMCSHVVRLTEPAEVDPDLRDWLHAAYDRA